MVDFSGKGASLIQDPDLQFRLDRAAQDTDNVEYSDEMANKVLLHIALRVPLARFKDIPEMPDEVTVIRWLMNYPSFEEMFYRAREVSMASFSEEILALADSLQHAYYTDFRGKRRVDTARIKEVEIKIDIRKWLMERQAPKRFGTRLKIDHTNRNLQNEQGDKLTAAFEKAADRAVQMLQDQREASKQLIINPDGTPANHPESDAFAMSVIKEKE